MTNRPKGSSLFLLIFATMMSLLISCSNTTNTSLSDSTNKLSIVNFNIDDIEKLDSDLIIDTLSCKIVRMETNKESAFGINIKPIVTDDYIIICDLETTQKVLLFDRDGRFIRRIGREGRGPGEYTRLTAVDINQKNHQIILYDLSTRKLIFYDYNGAFLKEINLKSYYGMTFSCINDTLFAFYLHRSMETELENEVLFVNDNGELINSGFQRKNKNDLAVSSNSGYFSRNGSDLYAIPTYSGKIYQIKDDENMVEKLNFMPEDYIKTDNDMKGLNESIEVFEIKKFKPFNEFIINNNGYFFCKSSYGNKPVNFIGDIKTGKVIPHTFLGSYSGSVFSTDMILSSYKDYFVTIKNVHRFKNSLFPDAEIGENACLMFFKVKDINELEY